jgi:DNA-directed RNA polymerase subunit D
MTAAERKEEKEGEESKMEVKLIESKKDDGKMSFLLKGSNTTFANLLRRYIVEKVPTMAIETVEFTENTSALYDEVFAHRLGLIPLSTDLKSYEMISKCKCGGEGCNRCTLKLTLKSEGPGIVYASEIKSKDPKVKPVFGKMIVAKLLKDQQVELLATAVLGQGNDHTKFSPGLAYYKLKPNVTLEKNVKNAEEVSAKCPVLIFNAKNNNLSVNKDKINDCLLCNQCVEIADPSDAVKVEQGPDIIFYVESWGQLSCKEMVLAALDEYNNDLNDIEELLKKQ